MKYLRQALAIIIFFSCKSTIANKGLQSTSSKNIHIAKAAGYSAVTALNSYAIYLTLDNGIHDKPILYYLVGCLALLSNHTGKNALKEYEEAFSPTDHTLSPRATHIVKAAGYSTAAALSSYRIYRTLNKGFSENTSSRYFLTACLAWISKHAGINAWKEYKEAFPHTDHTLSPRNMHSIKAAGYSTVTVINILASGHILVNFPRNPEALYLIGAATWLSYYMGTNAWKEYKEAFTSIHKTNLKK